MRIARRFAFVALCALGALAIAGCDDDPLPRGLPIAEAETARQLKLLVLPPIETVARETFTTEQTELGRRSDSRNEYLKNTYGRLGFFPSDFDLDPVQGKTSTLYAAFYSSDEKKITLIGEPSEEVVLHELVHAIQDQHFDLNAYREDVISSDESLAKSGLVEGDAVIAELRHKVTAMGYPPEILARYVTGSDASKLAKQTLDKNKDVPPFFLAQAAFSYTYGPVHALAATGATNSSSRWDWGRVNRLFTERRPLTTKAVMGPFEDRVLAVGLTRLPGELAGFYAIDEVDRLGAWFTYLLFYRSAVGRDLESLATAWTGDQLVIVHRRDTRIGTPNGPSGVVWTSAWEKIGDADSIVKELHTLHGLARTADDPQERSWRARDGEPVWMEKRGTQVSFVKNVPYDDARVFADRALSTPDDQKKMAIQRRVFDGPRRFPCTFSSRRASRP